MTFGAGHFYVSQSDKGGLVFGGDIDGYNSYAQRGNLPVMEDVCEGGMALMPMIGRVRVLRQWGGIMDMSMDGSPIIDKTPIDGLYLNAGWCYGGFKATPASGLVFAHLLARDEPHKEAERFRLDRFRRGAMIDEKGAGRPTQSALRTARHAHSLSALRTARSRRIHLSRRRQPQRPAADAGADAVYRLCLSARQHRRRAWKSSGITAAAAGPG